MDEDSQAGTDRGWASLTDAERCVVPCVAAGMTDRSIAEKLHVAHHTVGAHLERLYHELDIHSRVELTALSMPHHG
ncbi:helix-turn-helix domain-containing protein [Lentzea albida]|uniref:Regulatory protein, luxR family n=1 Tax=Lentzea albida TaxID=65499 RepID=A0A1H9J613_9PSEU|nr:helix-turn-helix transcriptional regulator [Lentzea albida]SEQ82169.1 regulatory protein, luxR family [Lentzea albida]